MKSIAKLFIFLGGLYCVVMLAISTWLMLSIYRDYQDSYRDNFESLYCVYHLATTFCSSVVFFVLHCFMVFQDKQIKNVFIVLNFFLIAVFLLYFSIVYSLSRGESNIFQEILYSSVLYLVLIVTNSVLVGFLVCRGHEK